MTMERLPPLPDRFVWEPGDVRFDDEPPDLVELVLGALANR